MVIERVNIDELIREALSEEDARSRDIVARRYGIGKSPDRKTLAALGGEYGLTRERIRQIESSSLRSIRDKIKDHEESIKFLRLLERYLDDADGIRRGDFLANDIAILSGSLEQGDSFYNKLHFLASVMRWPHISGGNEEWYLTWHSKPEYYKEAQKTVSYLLSVGEHDFERFLKSVSKKLGKTEPQIVNHLTISKRFGIGPYGDMGADSWLHVNPKTVRDRVYLVLEKTDEPLHFREIARLVNELSDKERTPATIHNELIKEPKFVLVGRGTYTINE